MKLRRLGFFVELAHGDPHGPSLRKSGHLSPDEKAAAVRYLRSGAVLAASQVSANDHFTGEALGTLNLLTDGTWVWPSDLPHYVEAHDVWLEPDFLSWIVNRADVRLTPEELVAAEDALFAPEA